MKNQNHCWKRLPGEVKLVSVDVSHDVSQNFISPFFLHLNQLSFVLDVIDPGISLHESFKVTITYP